MSTRLTRTMPRALLALPLLVAGLGATSTVARMGPAAPLCTQAAFDHRVGLVVEHGDGRVLRRCVGFTGSSISAIGVLQASGVETGLEPYGALGTAICQIDDEPASYSTCLPASGSYWVLFVARPGGAWSDSALGASTVTVTSGDDVGFRYDPQAGADPPPPSPAGTCPAATPAPATRSSTPAAPAGHSPVPTTHGAGAGTPPARGVPGPSDPAAGPSPRATTTAGLAAGAGSPFNPGLLLAVVGGGGLIGLLGVQGARRRRR